jgi:hypothetical protein
MKIYPTEIEAIDEDGKLIFKLETVDGFCAQLTINTLVSNSSIDELCAEIKNALLLLDLENETNIDKKM